MFESICEHERDTVCVRVMRKCHCAFMASEKSKSADVTLHALRHLPFQETLRKRAESIIASIDIDADAAPLSLHSAQVFCTDAPATWAVRAGV